MKFLIILLLIKVVSLIKGEEQITFILYPTNASVKYDEDIKMNCTVSKEVQDCFWSKDDKAIRISLPKYEFASSKKNDCSLLLHKAQLNDEGTWKCIVYFNDCLESYLMTSPPGKLTVFVPPSNLTIELDKHKIENGRNVTVTESNSYIFKCTALLGNPPATLRWVLGNKELTPLGSQVNEEIDGQIFASLEVKIDIETEHHGNELKCEAIHSSSTYSSSSHIIIYVIEKFGIVNIILLSASVILAILSFAYAIYNKILRIANPPQYIVQWHQYNTSRTLRPMSRNEV